MRYAVRNITEARPCMEIRMARDELRVSKQTDTTTTTIVKGTQWDLVSYSSA